ncbi:phage tail sheath C-terminal domain-containing protein [Pyxidicoccus sp. 3LG]
MSETIGEMILPGTYIDVRAEGLIGVGGISTGNVGIVGTASRGPVNEVKLLGSYTEALDMFGSYDAWSSEASANPLSLTRALEQLFAGGAATVYAVRVANVEGTLPSTTWNVTATIATVDTTVFTLTAKTPGTWGNDISVTVSTLTGPNRTRLLVTHGRVKEEFIAANAGALAAAVNAGSTLVTAGTVAAANAGELANKVANPTTVTSNGNAPTDIQFAAGLALLANQPVNIVVVAGATAKDNAAPVLAHLEATENDGRERIAVLGASTDDPATIGSADAGAVSSGRVILVAPGIVAADAAKANQANPQSRLPPAYTAALVAGRLSSLAPHVSLTNKDLPVSDVTTEYTRAQQKSLLGNRVLAVKKDLGFRVLKGITTDTGAFKQISVRRIVDYAKAGVRIGSNPYIGRLNNSRVRAALQATLDGFLSGMVLDEMLTKYTLKVSATRQQEINGIALVEMTLQPTFSIDFVKVIMNLE